MKVVATDTVESYLENDYAYLYHRPKRIEIP